MLILRVIAPRTYKVIISDNWVKYDESPRCECCKSTQVTYVGKISIGMATHDAYACGTCNKVTTGLAGGKLEALSKLHEKSGMTNGVSWSQNMANNQATIGTSTGMNMGNFGTSMYPNTPLTTNDQQTQEQLRQLGTKLDTVNSNIMALVFEMQNLLRKIDDAKLTDPFSGILNRVKNFELK